MLGSCICRGIYTLVEEVGRCIRLAEMGRYVLASLPFSSTGFFMVRRIECLAISKAMPLSVLEWLSAQY